MDQDKQLFGHVLLRLQRRGQQDINDVPGLEGDALWRSLNGRDVNEVELEKTLASDTVNFEKRWVVLPVDKSKTWRPFLWMDVDFAKPRASFQVVFANLKEPNAAMGFRFETPSLPGEDDKPGIHHYHHVQPLKEVRPFGAIHGIPTWIPKSFPTFPLEASTPSALGFCLFLSIYGFGFEESFISDASVRQQLAKHYGSMSSVGPPAKKVAPLPKSNRKRRGRKPR